MRQASGAKVYNRDRRLTPAIPSDGRIAQDKYDEKET